MAHISRLRPWRFAIGSKRTDVAFGLILALSTFALSGTLLRREPRVDLASHIHPRITPSGGYVGSAVCSSCHPYQHASWYASYHRSMTQLADRRAVLAPFDGSELELNNVTWRMEERADGFWVRGREPIPESDRFREVEKRIVMTTGSHNYQLYWMEGAGGSGMIPLPLVYLPYDRVWIPRVSRFLTPPVPRAPVEAGRWSVHCIRCHATQGQPEALPGGETRVAELGISCEACHGPGQEHARRNRSPLRRFRLYASHDADPTIVNPARLSHDRSTEICGHCHSIEIFLKSEDAEDWRHAGSRYRPGDVLAETQTTVVGRYEDNPPDVREYIDHHAVFKLKNCFWPDGMLRVAGREYHGMVETPCYQKGEMSCLSCHRLHRPKDDSRSFTEWADDQLGVETEGDHACTQCHQAYDNPASVAAHTHHAPESTGSRCYNCHMPYTTWGLLRAIRSHTVDSPNVATSTTTGRPNACNQCHLDRTLLWTAEKLQEWYDIEPPELTEDQRTVAASILWTLSGDAVQRALMAWSMGWDPARLASGTTWMVPYLCTLLVDPYDAVRFRAQRTLRLYPEYRASTLDSIAGASKPMQSAMMTSILTSWNHSFAASGGQSGSQLLILPNAMIDKAGFARLTSLRDDEEVLLFE